MVLGILAGAFLSDRHGWSAVWICAITVTALSVIDDVWGVSIGRALADMTKAIIQ